MFAQWGISSPEKGTTATQPGAITKIKFGLGWGDGVKLQYEIHCLHSSTTSQPLTNDWKKVSYRTTVDIHVFAKRQANSNGFSESTQLFNMMQEVDRIINQKRLNLGENVKPMKLVEWVRADDPEEYGSNAYWHRIARVEVWYWRVDTS